MVDPREPPPALPIVGGLASDLERLEAAVEELAGGYGGLDLRGAPEPFDETRYYEPEMGGGLQRRFCSFRQLVAPERLPELKEAARLIELRFSDGGRRLVNLDPGVLDLTKVVLASFKPGPQKLHLGGGVWADIVLYYADGRFGPLPWTFPDLRGGAHEAFFAEARQRYKKRLRARRRSEIREQRRDG